MSTESTWKYLRKKIRREIREKRIRDGVGKGKKKQASKMGRQDRPEKMLKGRKAQTNRMNGKMISCC